MNRPQARPQAEIDSRRRKIAIALILLGAVVGFFAVYAVWVKRQALETETWTRTSTELLEREEIRDAVADFMVAELFEHVDVQREIERRLPPEARALAGPTAGGLRQLTDQLAREALARPQVQALWEDANRAAHAQLIATIDDEGEFVSTGEGVVTLKLDRIAAEIGEDAGIGEDLSGRLPADAAEIEILRSDQLEAAQGGVRLLRVLAYGLSALTLVLFAVAVGIATGWRREALRAVGFAFVAVGALALLAHAVVGGAVVDEFAATAAAEPPVRATWEVGTSLLVATADSIVVYGLVIVLAAWVAGPSATATWVRGGVAPYLRQPRIAYSALAVLLVLILWWGPTEGTRRLLPSLLLIALLVAGVEVLRRQVVREFPNRVTLWSPAGTAQRIARRMREARERRLASSGPAGESAEEQRIAQLERLARLREAGVLTEEELREEKRRIRDG